MKKLIATTAIVASACFGFYISESGSLTDAANAVGQKVSFDNILGLSVIGSHPLDIGQADIK